jgi:hypothetical protein
MTRAGRVCPITSAALGRVDQSIAIVVDLSAADVFVREVAADKTFLRFRSGDAADAPERRQVQEPIVFAGRLFPHKEAGAFDVVRIGEAHERAIAGHRTPGASAQADQRERAFTLTALAIDEPHAHRHAHVASALAMFDLMREPVSARFGCGAYGTLLREKLVPGPIIQEEQ